MDLLRIPAVIDTYYYTVVLLVKRNTRISYWYLYRTFMFLLFTRVGNYQNLESQISALTNDVLSISSHSHFYSERVSLYYASLVKLAPIRWMSKNDRMRLLTRYCKLGAVTRSDERASTWYADGCVFDDYARLHSCVETGHEILSFPAADSVTDERNWLTARHDHSYWLEQT